MDNIQSAPIQPKSKIWLFIGIAVVLVAGTVTYFLFFSGKTSTEENFGGSEIEGKTFCNGLDEENKENCFQAILEKDTSLCEDMFYEYDWGACYTGVAIEKNDISICDSKEGEEFKETCFFAFAVKNKDTSLCEKSQDSKSECLISIATTYKDISICDSMEDQSFKEYCSQAVNRVN